MDNTTRAEYDEKSKELRAELKRWENEWAQTHDGKKPERQDIKDNAEIAKKYKDYNKYRDILSGKIPPPSKTKPQPKKRPSDPAPAVTPLKRTKYAETPSKQRPHDDELMNTPAISRKLFSPAPVTSLGPTPQRDGRVLGLFDLLVEKELGTPSRKENPRSQGTPSRAGVNGFSTPSRRTVMRDAESTMRLDRTPMSSSKKQMLNMFATPMKNRRGSTDDKTPSSVSKLQFDTPAFLKRHSLAVLDENALFADPAPLRLPRKPMVRGLSEIVASLRKVEEDVLEDDMDALREMENEAADLSRPLSPSMGTKPAPTTASTSASAPVPRSVLEPDSQGRPALLGGFDNEEMYDSAHEDGVDRHGNPLPVFKKKGQKRTTRKANIKPTMKKRPQAVAQEQGSGDDDDQEVDVVPETQLLAAPDGDYRGGPSPDEASAPRADKKTNKRDGPVKKAARKVNELAHANFKRLKLRNHGSKGGPGFNSRFRRRR
ncbi:hypothetical protein E4U42_002915 [Claviceps africana]|uniref:DNA replication regulator SLD2 n=1 Tax=Claviceps africana TaxID=83212 RepID=A0A8K0J7D5_9HYPO|nr:hypothetical protein E4U42_002915 [Claviceps africana]